MDVKVHGGLSLDRSRVEALPRESGSGNLGDQRLSFLDLSLRGIVAIQQRAGEWAGGGLAPGSNGSRVAPQLDSVGIVLVLAIAEDGVVVVPRPETVDTVCALDEGGVAGAAVLLQPAKVAAVATNAMTTSTRRERGLMTALRMSASAR